MDFNLASYGFLGSVPLILGIVQAVKAWVKDSRFYPVISIILGIAINVLIAVGTGGSYIAAVFMGVIAGLSAGGIYGAATTKVDKASEMDNVSKPWPRPEQKP
jgi:hypothetical protein